MTKHFNLEIESGDRIRVLRVAGRFDGEAASELRSRLDYPEDDDVITVLLDFSRLDYISSTCLAALFEAIKRHKELEVGFAIFGADPKILRLLDLGGISSLVPHYPGREDALRDLAPAL